MGNSWECEEWQVCGVRAIESRKTGGGDLWWWEGSSAGLDSWHNPPSKEWLPDIPMRPTRGTAERGWSRLLVGGRGSRGRGPGDRGRHGCQGGAGRAGGPWADTAATSRALCVDSVGSRNGADSGTGSDSAPTQQPQELESSEGGTAGMPMLVYRPPGTCRRLHWRRSRTGQKAQAGRPWGRPDLSLSCLRGSATNVSLLPP